MKLTISKNANPNYLAKVIKVSNIRKHHNADKLQIITVDGNNVIIDLSMKINDVVVYIPAEACIADWFLKKYNQYREGNLNDNSSEKGFFEENRRVKAIRLRNEQSCGIIFPIDKFTSDTKLDQYINIEFDTIDGQLFCEKYIPTFINTEVEGNKINKKRSKNIKRLSKVIEDQFRFHIDTVHFGKNIYKFQLDDIVQLTAKLHGTSASFARVICKKNLKWYEKLFKNIIPSIPDVDYDYLYASRSVVKNSNMNPEVTPGFYDTDVWNLHFNKVKDFLEKGMTFYGEIVGYIEGTSRGIQSIGGQVFDYGCPVGISELYIYRITYTNSDGKVYEFSAKQVQDWCNEHGLKVVPEIFYGKFREILSSELVDRKIAIDNGITYENVTDDTGYTYSTYSPSHKEKLSVWENDVLEFLRDKYLEGDDPMCVNTVPFEGVVFRREKNVIDSYKFKSYRFLQKETESLDKGEIDIETQESISNNIE